MNTRGIINQGIAAITVILIIAVFSCLASCPPINATIPLDLDKFEGSWFPIATTPTNGKKISRCMHFAVTKTSNKTFSLIFTALSHRTNRSVTFTANGTVANGITGTWQLKGSKRKFPILGPFDHRFIAANYSSHVIMIVCANNNPDLPLNEFAVIMAKNKFPSRESLDALKTDLHPYFNPNVILNVDQNNCSEETETTTKTTKFKKIRTIISMHF